MARSRFELETGGRVVLWPTAYREVCLFAIDGESDGDEEYTDEEAAFLKPDEARAIARALLEAADEAERG